MTLKQFAELLVDRVMHKVRYTEVRAENGVRYTARTGAVHAFTATDRQKSMQKRVMSSKAGRHVPSDPYAITAEPEPMETSTEDRHYWRNRKVRMPHVG